MQAEIDAMEVEQDDDDEMTAPPAIKAHTTTTTTTTTPDDPMDIVPPDNNNDDLIFETQEEEARQAIDMLRGDDVSGRVAAASRLEAVAVALGHERTRNELLPFLTDGVDDEDEVLVAMASSLGKLVHHVGGPAHVHTLLPPLELLLTVEETTVREAAAASARAVARVLPDDAFQELYADGMLARLATKEWFTARLSAATLITDAYPRLLPNQQDDFLQYYCTLCRDDTPMVRRVASQYLGDFVETLVKVHGKQTSFAADGKVTQQLLPLFEELASNEQPDSVRLQTTGNCVVFGNSLAPNNNNNETTTDGSSLEELATPLIQRILPLIVATIDDRSWRVRWTAASKFAEVVRAFESLENDAVTDALIAAYEKLLQDPEAEVRTAATYNLAAVAHSSARVIVLQHGTTSTTTTDTSRSDPEEPETGGEAATANDDKNDSLAAETTTNVPQRRVSVAERLVQRVTHLTEDDSEHVRAALAMVATELAPILGKDATITHLVPPVLLLLRDAASEVRLNLISSLSALNQVIGVDLLSQSLLPAILDLAQDGKWRIRLAIIQHIPLLAKQLGKDFFSDKLASLCVGWLGDDISSIRQASATNLKDLTALFGTAWATEYLIPSIADIRKHPSYLRRLTAVQACALMATEMEAETARTELLPMVLEMATDSVPNIRFNVAKGLEMMAPVCGSDVYDSQIRPVLSVLIDDPDRDVKYFATRTLRLLDAQLQRQRKT